MTGRAPYCEFKRDSLVTLAVIRGEYPRQPAELSSVAKHGDERWAMMLKCWQEQPELRPRAGNVKFEVGGCISP
jgi:hypothetical protein